MIIKQKQHHQQKQNEIKKTKRIKIKTLPENETNLFPS